MKIKLLTSHSGAGFSCPAGAIVDRPDDETKRMIESGAAEAVPKGASVTGKFETPPPPVKPKREKPKTEKAAETDPPETADAE